MPTSSAPKVFIGAAARTFPTPKSRSMSRRLSRSRSSCSSCPMASGMARSHRGLRGHRAGPQRQVAAVPVWWRRGRRPAAQTRRRPRLAGCASGSTSGASDGGGSGPSGGRGLDAGGGRGRGELDGHDAGGAARAPGGRGGLVDVGRQTSVPARARHSRGGELFPERDPGALSTSAPALALLQLLAASGPVRARCWTAAAPAMLAGSQNPQSRRPPSRRRASRSPRPLRPGDRVGDSPSRGAVAEDL